MSRLGVPRLVVLLTLLSVSLLVVLVVGRALVGAYLLSHQDETDGTESLESAERKLTRVTRASVAAAMGPRVALVTSPEVRDGIGDNPVSVQCGTFDVDRVDSPLRSSYYYSLAGTDTSRFARYAEDLEDYLTARGWSISSSSAEGIELHRGFYALGISVPRDGHAVALFARTPCLRSDDPGRT